MANPYEVPFTPPDLGPAVALFTAARQRRQENKRADKYLELAALDRANTAERESHTIARQKAEDERKRAIETWTAMPTLMRAAQKSTGMANVNPYGVKFDETRDLPANVEGPEMSPAAEAARFAPKPPATQPEAPIPEPGMPGSPFEGPRAPGPEDAPDSTFFTDSGGPQMPAPAAPPPQAPLMAQAAANTLGMEPGPEGKRRIFASVGGNRFEVPEQPDTTGLGPKYDAIYQRFLQEPGVTPEEALKAVTKMAHEDSVEAGRNQRLIDAEAGRDRRFEGYHMDVEQQFDALGRRLAQSEKNARIGAGARIATAGTASVPAEVLAAMSKYATERPGDPEGLYGIAKAANIADPAKAVGAVLSQNRPTEGQSKDARQAAIGLRAIDEIERTGYVPQKADVQKWLNNSRLVHAADQEGIKGLAFSLGQSVNLVPQSEVEGLSEPAQQYFANVRRYMETIGRAQSGAAIAPTEWTNFFNQYGPNSRGGLAAARQYLRDQFTVSGSAGRQLEASGSVPKQGGGAHPSQAPVGETRTGPDGKTYRKVGPNNWQPVAP